MLHISSSCFHVSMIPMLDYMSIVAGRCYSYRTMTRSLQVQQRLRVSQETVQFILQQVDPHGVRVQGDNTDPLVHILLQRSEWCVAYRWPWRAASLQNSYFWV